MSTYKTIGVAVGLAKAAAAALKIWNLLKG
jgi:hypothetical protein